MSAFSTWTLGEAPDLVAPVVPGEARVRVEVERAVRAAGERNVDGAPDLDLAADLAADRAALLLTRGKVETATAAAFAWRHLRAEAVRALDARMAAYAAGSGAT